MTRFSRLTFSIRIFHFLTIFIFRTRQSLKLYLSWRRTPGKYRVQKQSLRQLLSPNPIKAIAKRWRNQPMEKKKGQIKKSHSMEIWWKGKAQIWYNFDLQYIPYNLKIDEKNFRRTWERTKEDLYEMGKFTSDSRQLQDPRSLYGHEGRQNVAQIATGALRWTTGK